MKKSSILAASAAILGTWAFLAAAVALAAKPAVVRLKADDIRAEVTFENRQKITLTSKGMEVAPGTYAVKSVSLFKKDDRGQVWELRTVEEKTKDKNKGQSKLGTFDTLTVEEEQEKVLDLGPPIVLQCVGRQGEKNPDTVTISFFAHGRYSEMYHPGAFLGGKRPPAPTFKVIAEDGKVLFTGTFDVTKEGPCRGTWKPGAWKGNYTVEIDAPFGPFETRLVQTEKHFVVK